MSLPNATKPLVAACLLVSAFATPSAQQQGELRITVGGLHPNASDAGTVTVTLGGTASPSISRTIPRVGTNGVTTGQLPVGVYDLVYQPPICHSMAPSSPRTVQVQVTDGQTTDVHFVVQALIDPPDFVARPGQPPCAPVGVVIVAPASVPLTTYHARQLEVQLADRTGNVLSSRVVTWQSSDMGVATVARTGSNSALVTGVSAGTSVITATSEGVTGTASVTVTPSPPSATTDILTLHDNAAIVGTVPGIDTTVVLFDARGPDGCIPDDTATTVASSSSVALDVGDLRSASGCETRVAAFSVGDAMALWENADWWTDGADTHAESLQTDPYHVPVRLRVADPAMIPKARADMMNAQLAFYNNRVGIEFELEYDATGEIVVETLSPAAKNLLGSSCAGAVPLRDDGDPTTYSPDTINVYYLTEVTDWWGTVTRWKAGFTCAAQGAAEIVLIADDELLPVLDETSHDMTLAHELGHAMGLLSPADGHAVTNDFPDDGTNIMSLGGSDPDDRERFTLGQIYRMNVGPDSWLIKNGARSDMAPCQCSPLPDASGPCPPIWKDFITPPDLLTGFGEPVCEVKITEVDLATEATSLCMAPNDTVELVAQTGIIEIGSDGTESTAYDSRHIRWWSTDKAIVDAELSTELVSGYELLVISGSVEGMATLTVFAGGIKASIDVEVSGTCPPP